MDVEAVTTAPWPGPGDSEGPVDPEGWAPVWPPRDLDDAPAPGTLPVSATPWPAPVTARARFPATDRSASPNGGVPFHVLGELGRRAAIATRAWRPGPR